MYAGTTFRTKSGRVMGVHQKIDRVARRHLKKYLHDNVDFPTIHDILHFEGMNGPDGIKRKSPSVDEPWHFINPQDPNDRALVDMILDHISNMTTALKNNNYERVAFEAAWMSHAVTDGLTPAHHYPLEAKLEELRGEGMSSRSSAKEKILIPGKTKIQMVRNNWEFWGTKGVMTTHVGFELGVATTIMSERLAKATPTQEQIEMLKSKGFEAVFRSIMKEIDDMRMYDEFSRFGWSGHLANETRLKLIPRIIQAVTLGWMLALHDAKKIKL